MKKYYIAYGSNLNVQQMRYRCPGARVVGTSVIKDYQLLYKGSKTGSYLTIEKKKGGIVPVAVWEVSERNEKSLDAYEGYPSFYYKTEMKLQLDGTKRKVNAFVYIMHEDRKQNVIVLVELTVRFARHENRQFLQIVVTRHTIQLRQHATAVMINADISRVNAVNINAQPGKV